MTACAGMRGPLVNLHQIQKCTWPRRWRRTVRQGGAAKSILAYCQPADGVKEVQVSGVHRQLKALTGPDAGNIHAFLATPVHQSIGMSMADAARIHPRTTLPANVGNQLLRRFAPGQLVRKADPTTLPLQP